MVFCHSSGITPDDRGITSDALQIAKYGSVGIFLSFLRWPLFACRVPVHRNWPRILAILQEIAKNSLTPPFRSLQIVAIVRTKSSDGISVSALGLGFIAAAFVMINKFILAWPALQCCATVWTAAQCGGHNLAVWQTIVTPVGIFATLVMVLMYFPLAPSKEGTYEHQVRLQRLGIVMFVGSIVLCGIVVSIAAILRFAANVPNSTMELFAQVVGICAAIAVIVHWAPQIWHTAFVAKSTKNFSVLSLAFQMPGVFLVVIFQVRLTTVASHFAPAHNYLCLG